LPFAVCFSNRKKQEKRGKTNPIKQLPFAFRTAKSKKKRFKNNLTLPFAFCFLSFAFQTLEKA